MRVGRGAATGGGRELVGEAGRRLVEGRGFTEADNRTDAAPVMVISESLARRVWPGQSAIGSGTGPA